MSVQLHPADCREVMRGMEPCSVDAIVSDPPYGLTTGLDPFAMVRSWLSDEMNRECWGKLAALGWTEEAARKFADELHPREEYQHGGVGFMGSRWDSIVPGPSYWREAYRVLKPGGYVLAFGATRTWHWLACALELCGFESRGSIAWLNGQGMQHGLDISKAMDADAGAEREVVGVDDRGRERTSGRGQWGGVQLGGALDITAPATEEAREWAGWGTQLAPKHEPIAMFRKPLGGTYVENIRAHGVGGLNIDGCRLEGEKPATTRGASTSGRATNSPIPAQGRIDDGLGRWPPNAVLDEAVQAQLDAMVGKRVSSPGVRNNSGSPPGRTRGVDVPTQGLGYGNVAGPSAYFYCPKAPTGERDHGCEHLRWVRDGSEWRLCEGSETPEIVGNPWPTVKPLELMRWLVRLVTPRGGLVLDPFLGSGTTGVAVVCEGEGRRFVGCDTSPVAHMIATARIRWAQGLGPEPEQVTAGLGGQASLF